MIPPNSIHDLDESDESNPPRVLPSEGRLLGIDYGTVRVGVAISDPSQTIASPLETYTRRNIKLDASYFIDLVKLEKIVGLVVGLPVHMSGDESEKSREAVRFGKWLQQSTERPVIWVDERYTTSMAREMLSHSPLSGKKRKAQLDKLAAQILLATYLESGAEADIKDLNQN
ncbi:MAG: Holliday junction resolvase RuvX [Planctomycetaceae bacterium]|nr:Holliday junction resolvase RuvX [Planctomycetaceae bacterium]MCP4478528.1 Holliday junction resolvase RuvX [Planctomycetaceae bacterium]